jgi:hypothetical protein
LCLLYSLVGLIGCILDGYQLPPHYFIDVPIEIGDLILEAVLEFVLLGYEFFGETTRHVHTALVDVDELLPQILLIDESRLLLLLFDASNLTLEFEFILLF